ncbi:decaprenyl-diphosphate synthase subunit 1-like [Anneissia japonica]|uniref:decaprenyl-diphosphate synthase subunit 1-like n=1 Tax=Anneissia japonica TaxID=1529436 RepID=UPI0014259032|nr:decaprenyl-diphosphate synthase subunit 1-like [Anneissia japonica]
MATSMRLRNTFRVQFYLRNDVILLPKLKLNVAKTSINPHCMYCVRHCTSYTIQKQLPNITRRYMITTKNIRLNSTNLRKTYLREYSTNLNSVDETIKTLAKEDLSVLCSDIQEELNTSNDELRIISQYHFDGEGKAFRPMMVVLMSKACNTHHNQDSRTLLHSQYRLAMITEMIHTASLIHDDVIDASPTRRGKPTVYKVWGEKKAILAGDYVLSVASLLLARLRNENVIVVLSQVIEDLVRGEFMQLGSKEDENERFHHYLLKTYKKTASLIANSCKAAAILGDSHPEVCDIAYNFGRNIGMAFQLIDDVLDFVSSSATFGKPTTADLNLGLATAPVLFAADKFPELHEMIMRRFRQEGDVDKARLAVEESDGIQQTRFLAERHCDEAIRQIKQLKASQEQAALINLAGFVLSRIK